MIEELKGADGVRCELRSTKNDLIFLGRIHSSDGYAITVTEASGRQVPPVIFNTEVKVIVHGLKKRKNSSPLILFGMVCGSTRNFWKIDRLKTFEFSEQREAFRQKIEAPARVMCVNSIYMPIRAHRTERYPATMCKLIDISLTGVLFSSRQKFDLGDWLLLLDVRFARGERPYVFTCQVARMQMLTKTDFAYGCKFQRIIEDDQDRLCQSIFTLQRLDIQGHR